jgi:hypothetical protein
VLEVQYERPTARTEKATRASQVSYESGGITMISSAYLTHPKKCWSRAGVVLTSEGPTEGKRGGPRAWAGVQSKRDPVTRSIIVQASTSTSSSTSSRAAIRRASTSKRHITLSKPNHPLLSRPSMGSRSTASCSRVHSTPFAGFQ